MCSSAAKFIWLLISGLNLVAVISLLAVRSDMSDLGEHDGGETVFAEAWPPDQAEEDRVALKQAIQQLRDSGDGGVLEEGSWEESLVRLGQKS